MSEKYKQPKDQLCWDCQKACGGCSWSKNLTPVEGWTAKKRKLKFGNVSDNTTYVIYECPEFVADSNYILDPRKSAKQMFVEFMLQAPKNKQMGREHMYRLYSDLCKVAGVEPYVTNSFYKELNTFMHSDIYLEKEYRNRAVFFTIRKRGVYESNT